MAQLPSKILVVDDDLDVLYTTKQVLKRHFKEIFTESSPKKALETLQEKSIDIVLLDMNFAPGITSGQEGLFWLRKMKKIAPECQVILHTAYGDIELAVQGMKQGASDFVVKPWQAEKLLASIQNVWKLVEANREVERLKNSRGILKREVDGMYPEIVSEDPSMVPIFRMMEKVAKTDANVLILGENGTGKELIARAIHNQSPRAEEAFVKVDLGAIPESLFESELFGHAKGAFTDAREDRVGRFELAEKGTLFLDEIGNLPLPLQAKLLTALQSRQVTRVGSNRPIPLNVRLICATNIPIHQRVADQGFRQDLLYRINTVEIPLPPLRERPKDIGVLAEYYLDHYAKKYDRKPMKIQAATLRKLMAYAWPGNVRELQHAVERAVILSEGSTLLSEDFPQEIHATAQHVEEGEGAKSLNIEDMEKQAIQSAIRKCGGNLTQAAKELGMGRSTLYRKIERYKL
ncbi:MAG: sigma-54 dependent transcriptional regulator [Bacteroidota bacterium]